jgi:hypothetical protein
METAAEQSKSAVAASANEKLALTAAALIICPTFSFALWTITCHVCVLRHVSFEALARVGPAVLAAGCLCGIVAAHAAVRLAKRERRIEVAERIRPGWTCIAIAAALVILFAAGLGYSAFWIGCVLLLLGTALRYVRGVSQGREDARAATRWQKVVVVSLVVIAPILTYVAHRPDVDDAVYVGTAADAIAHPELPVLSHDAIYGDQKLPLMLASYAVESYELLIALLARSLGGAPILWAHAIVPTILAALIPIAWAGLMRILTPRYWVAGTALALVALSFPADFRGFGNFAFVRLFQAKAVFVSVGIPLLYTFAWRFEETGSIWNWIILLAGTIACVGLSSSAIFVAPLALVMAALAGCSRGLTKRAGLILLAALYPLACGLFVLRGFQSMQAVFARLPVRASLAVPMVFGSHTEYVFLFALLSAPFLTRDGRLRRLLLVLVLAYFLISINPFTFKFLSRFTTRDAVWRLLWCMPVAAIVASATVNAIRLAANRWGRRGLAIAVFVLACGVVYMAPYSSWAKSNGVSYSLRPLKVSDSDYQTARDAIAAAPTNSSVIAPEHIAVWIPTFVDRVPLVSVREIYDAEMGAHLSTDDARMRRELREFVSGQLFPANDTEQFVDALIHYHVGLVISPSSATPRIAPALTQRNFTISREENGYTFFRNTHD